MEVDDGGSEEEDDEKEDEDEVPWMLEALTVQTEYVGTPESLFDRHVLLGIQQLAMNHGWREESWHTGWLHLVCNIFNATVWWSIYRLSVLLIAVSL